jgi:hypothetical protein
LISLVKHWIRSPILADVVIELSELLFEFRHWSLLRPSNHEGKIVNVRTLTKKISTRATRNTVGEDPIDGDRKKTESERKTRILEKVHFGNLVSLLTTFE